MRYKQLLQTTCLVTAILLLVGCATSKIQAQKEPAPDYVEVKVMYATDRRIDDITKPEKYFGGYRGEMSYGVCKVAIKTDKVKTEFAGGNKLNEIKASKHKKLLSIESMDQGDFLKKLSVRINSSSDKSAVVYVHGYARKFKKAAVNLAGLVFEINYQGVPVLYSWPSSGKAENYVGDANTVNWSAPHLYDFLKLLVEQHELETIHVVAHSMGNQAFLLALMQMLGEKEVADNWKFGEIVLISPDVDRDIFERDIAPVIVHAPSRITLYVSSKDIPLQASKAINLYPRVGDASFEPLVFSGIDTIDASEVANLITGHSFYRTTPEALQDLHYLIKRGLGPVERPTLSPMKSEQGQYWEINNQK